MKTKSPVKIGAYLIAVVALLLIPYVGAYAAGPNIPQGFFLENPYSFTGVRANFEIVDLDDPPDGVLIMNMVRVDINLYENFVGLYAKFPFSGVVNFGVAEEDNYEFGNLGLGGKFALVNTESLILTTGLELIFPTSGGDLAAAAARTYFRDLPYFVDDALTLIPYAVIGVGRDWWSLQGNFAAEIMTNADELEGDDAELRLKYGLEGGITPDLQFPFSTTFLLELLFVSSTSFNDDVTEFYITPGFRLGGRILDLGVGVQIPVGEKVDNFSNANYFMDVILRFGS